MSTASLAAAIMAAHGLHPALPECLACREPWPCPPRRLAVLAQDQAAALDRVKALANESRYRNSCSADWSEIRAALAGDQS